MSDNILKLKDREVLDALCFLHSLARENTRYETQEEAFLVVYNHIKELESRTGECDRDCKSCWKTKLVNEPKVGEWIPCSERLPQEDESVLITTKTTDKIYFGTYTKGYGFSMREGFICGDGFMWLNTAVAWMSLPPAYKGE